MTADDPVITELAEANPVGSEASSDPHARAEADRIMRRVLADAPPSRRGWLRPGILAPVMSVIVVLVVAAVVLRNGGASTTSSSSSGGLKITLAALPTPQTPRVTSSAMTRERNLVRERLGSVLRRFTVTRVGNNGLVITGPDVTAAQRARIIPLITQSAQLSFYDWEASAVAPNGRTAAQELRHNRSALTLSQGTDGGPGQAGAGSLPLYDAVALAAKQPSRMASRSMARTGAEYYMFGAPGSAACAAVAAAAHTVPASGTHCLLAGPLDLPGTASRQRAIDALAATLPAGVGASAGRVLSIPQGTRVIQTVTPGQVGLASPSAQFFVIRDEVALTGRDIVNPHVGGDASGQPAVTFGFTPAGERAFHTATRAIATRGAQVSLSGETLSQHFAVVLDSRLLTVPSIDFNQYPDGIQAARADIVGGFTRQSGADLATQLRYGALPLALRVTR